VEVQRLGPDDHDLAVNAIHLLKAPDGYPTPSADDMTKFLSRRSNVLIVATGLGVPVGYIVAYLLDRIDRKPGMMFFYEIGVVESYRRRGIGKQMIAELKTICRAEDVMKMWVPTSRSNIAAARLYASTGAVPLSGDDEVTFTYPRESFVVP
jgi:ribosomal protein S18 acetylase RimI-like enzyme